MWLTEPHVREKGWSVPPDRRRSTSSGGAPRTSCYRLMIDQNTILACGSVVHYLIFCTKILHLVQNFRAKEWLLPPCRRRYPLSGVDFFAGSQWNAADRIGRGRRSSAAFPALGRAADALLRVPTPKYLHLRGRYPPPNAGSPDTCQHWPFRDFRSCRVVRGPNAHRVISVYLR